LPLRALIPGQIAPERLYLEARWSSLVPYAAAAGLLADVLPIASGANRTTVREHALRVAERVEAELGEERPCFIEGCPAEWAALPIPEGRIVAALDGGYVRNWDDRKSNFEPIVGRSVPEDRPPCYLGLVHGYDQKPKRRLFEMLKSQGLQANQDVTFLTDGGEEVRSLTELVTPEAEHVLDWFHITMRLTVLSQYARGVSHYDPAEGARLLSALDSIKWLLWHGNQYRAGEEIAFLEGDVDRLELEYPHLGKFTRVAHEFAVYIATNAGSLINYSERFRSGERISSCLAESTVNAVISKRFAKRQQMQWTKLPSYPVKIAVQTIGQAVTPIPPINNPPPASNFLIENQSNHQQSNAQGDNYTGLLHSLDWQLIMASSDNLNITAMVPNVFMKSGSGFDALDVSHVNGNNVLDGSTGSNFLVGGTGHDVFFLDDRNLVSDVYSTVVNFHAGDDITVWGVNSTAFKVSTENNQGAVNAKGLTYHFTATSKPTASVVIAGFSSSDLTNGRLTASYGRTNDSPGQPGTQYLNIHGN